MRHKHELYGGREVRVAPLHGGREVLQRRANYSNSGSLDDRSQNLSHLCDNAYVHPRQYERYVSLLASVIASLTFVNRTEYDTAEFRAAEVIQTCAKARALMSNQPRTSSSRSRQAIDLL